MPLLIHPMVTTLGMHRFTVQLSREADCEIRDIDRLLNLALTLREDLPGFNRDQLSEGMLIVSQCLTNTTN